MEPHLREFMDINFTVGDITLIRWIEGHTYEANTGATYYSGSEVPSLEDAEDCLANPRPFPLLASSYEIKAEAQKRILLISPAWKQSNMIARVLELVRDNGANVTDWPIAYRNENALYQGAWDRIKAIRTFSDALEASPPLLIELENVGWPV
jgi:hypothetical protein